MQIRNCLEERTWYKKTLQWYIRDMFSQAHPIWLNFQTINTQQISITEAGDIVIQASPTRICFRFG